MSTNALCGIGDERTAREVEAVAHERHTVGRRHELCGGNGRAPRGAAVVARERLPVGRCDVQKAAEGGHLEFLIWAIANGCSEYGEGDDE